MGCPFFRGHIRMFSAYQIEKATYMYADYWFFTHKKRISHDKISDFINMHKEDLKLIFSQTIILAEKNKLLSFDALYQDGYHVKANAAMKKGRTLKELKLRRKKVKKRLEEVLTKIQSPEKEDDDVMNKKKKYEEDLKRIDDLQCELNKKIRQRTSNTTPSRKKELERSFQVNETDKDSEITKMKDGSYVNAYTKINAVDGKADIIVATDVSGHYDESHRLCRVTKQANDNCKGYGKYKKVCADSNFNTLGSSVNMEANGFQLIAPTKQHEKKRKQPEKYKNMIEYKYSKKDNTIRCSEGNILHQTGQSVLRQFGCQTYLYSNENGCRKCKRKKECTQALFKEIRRDVRQAVQERVYKRYLSKKGQELYKKRMHAAEIFQADQKQNGKFTQLLRRGLKKVKAELMLQDITWNLRRIFQAAEGEIQWA